MKTVGCIVPVRSGSKRVLNKNTRPFAGIEGGLLELKLLQLKQVNSIERLVVSTNDPKAIDICRRLEVEYIVRPEELCKDETTALQMIHHAPDVLDNQYIMWAHVTSPLVTAELYEDMIKTFFNGSNDGLLTVTEFRNFLMNKDKQIVNNLSDNPWPRTQDLEPLYEVTHSVFLTTRFRHIHGSRYGINPILYTLPKLRCVDVDWPDDFDIAEQMFSVLRNRIKLV